MPLAASGGARRTRPSPAEDHRARPELVGESGAACERTGLFLFAVVVISPVLVVELGGRRAKERRAGPFLVREKSPLEPRPDGPRRVPPCVARDDAGVERVAPDFVPRPAGGERAREEHVAQLTDGVLSEPG